MKSEKELNIIKGLRLMFTASTAAFEMQEILLGRVVEKDVYEIHKKILIEVSKDNPDFEIVSKYMDELEKLISTQSDTSTGTNPETDS